jgi:hypothetical protein
LQTRIHVLALCLAISTAAAAETTPDVGLVDATIHVRNDPKQPIPVVVYAEGAELLQATDPKSATLKDLVEGADGVTVKFGRLQVVTVTKSAANNQLTAKRIEWSTTATVAGLPLNTTITRDAVLVVGAEMRRLRYDVTNKPASLTWTTYSVPAAEVAVRDTPVKLPFSVTLAGNGRDTNVYVARHALRDSVTGRVVPADALTVRTNTAAVDSTAPLTLTVDGAKLRPGKYTGTVEIAASGATGAQSFPLTISVSRWYARLLGFLAILAGVALAFWIGTIARNRVERLDAVLPAARLTQIAGQLETKLDACDAAASHTHTLLQRIASELAPSSLEQRRFIPSQMPWAFARAIDADGYAKHLQDSGTRLDNLTFLVDSGFCRVRQVTTNPDKQRQAFDALDKLGDLPSEQLQTEVAKILGGVADSQDEDTDREDRERKAPTTQEILVHIASTNTLVWFAWAVIAAIGGFLYLVDSNPGFGSVGDVGKAFLWGLGVQATGQQLQQLTPSSVATSVGVTLPSPSRPAG